MNAKKLYLLIAAAVLALAIAIGVQTMRQPQTEASRKAEPLLPQLRGHINDVNAITMTGADAKVIVTLKRGAGGWTIAEKSGYPADVTKVRELLLNLDQSVLIEPKTTNPSRYADIGVDDVKSKDTEGVRIDIAGLAQPASLIIGLYNGKNGEGTFVRRADDAQSWLASGNLTVTKRIADWERHELTDIASSRLKSVTLTGLDGKQIRFYKERAEDADFKLADVPKGREPPTAFVLNGLASNLAGLKTTETFPAGEAEPPDKVYKAEYTAFDGLVITVIAWQGEGKNFARLSARVDPAAAAAPSDADKVKAEADALNEVFSGWTYTLFPHRFGQLRKTMDDLLQPLSATASGAKDAQASSATVPPKSR